MAVATARRLEKVDAALTRTQLVLRWLAEAHTHGSLSAYVDSMLDEPPEDFPLNRLAREAIASGQAGSKSQVREDPVAVRRTLQATVFRFDLVMRINVTTHELLDREALVGAVLAGHIAHLASEPAAGRASDPSYREHLAASRALTLRRVVELHAAQEARSIAEGKYLDSRPALFPEGLAAWDATVHDSERLAVMTDRLAELDGLGSDLDDEAAVAVRVPQALADLVEPAKVTALEKLGDGEQAIRIATRWLGSRRQADSDSIAPTR